MVNNGVVIRALRRDETQHVTEMVLSNLFQEEVNLRKASRLMRKPVGNILVACLLIIFYTMTGSIALSVVFAPLAALLSCWGCLWKMHQGHRQRNQLELQDIFEWYNKTGSRFWVAVDGREIVGTVALNRVNDSRAELTRMCVLPPYRRRGLARRLKFSSELVTSTLRVFQLSSAMENSGVVIRALRRDETQHVTEMVLSSFFQEGASLRNASRLMRKPVGNILVACLLIIFYTMTGSIALSVVLAPLAALLFCQWCLWKVHEEHRQRNQLELQDIFEWYNKTGSRFWVAVDGREMVGTVALHRVNDSRAKFTRMGVIPPYRRRGVARRLVRHVEAFCKSEGVLEIFMTTTEFHLNALSLYRKCGYVLSDVSVTSPVPGVNVSIVELSKKLQ
ncbi:N-acetylaspartate synthetase-like [Branchiostoma lanceolatum]|uniref:N-acetylaspartate synthetase-like n=1 Tax=Branchiostoma lanceolatum TaxID=7740 RepID=UPI0034545748